MSKLSDFFGAAREVRGLNRIEALGKAGRVSDLVALTESRG